MKTHEVYRWIDGKLYRCRDIGCEDFARAEENRFIIENQLFTTFYEQMENWFRHTPQGSPLPLWMPLGVLPYVGRGRQSGDWVGLDEVEGSEVVDKE